MRASSLRPSPSMIVAMLALFISLGGVSYAVATGSIDSRELKDNAIRSKDVRNDAVRGVDVRESTLGQVPSAAAAGDAARLGGLEPGAFLRSDAAAGGDLAGTFPNPTLAAGSVGSGAVEDASLRASDLSVYTTDVSVTINIPAHSCHNNDFAVPQIQAGDRVLLFTRNVETDPDVQARVIVDSQFATENGRLPFRACNLGAAALTNETIPVNVIVIRP
jgi:hypothetical protein